MTARHVQVLVFRLLVGAIVLACLVAATTTLDAEHVVSLRVTPRRAFAPATVSSPSPSNGMRRTGCW